MQDRDTLRKIEDILSALVLNVEQICHCEFTRDHITNSAFQCFPGSPQAVTYRAVLHGTTSASNSDLILYIEQWISDSVTISIQNILINVDPSCVLVIDCVHDNECGATDQPTVVTTLYDTSSLSNNIGVAVGSTVVAVVVLSLSIAVTIVAILLFKWRKNFNRTRTDVLLSYIVNL